MTKSVSIEMTKILKKLILVACLGSISINLFAANHMASDRISDIRNTKHNFAKDDIVSLPGSDERDVTSTTENEVCVYCHTPHGDPNNEALHIPFLWNRTMSTAGYNVYSSSSLTVQSQTPGQASKMCLSCHDGTVAIGQVDVLNGRLGSEVGPISMQGNNVNGGLLTGNSNIGTDLSNDHPVGFVYDSSLAGSTAGKDAELIDPDDVSEGAHIGIRVGSGVANFNQSVVDGGGTAGSDNPVAANTSIAVPLESTAPYRNDTDTGFVSVAATGSVECTTCHDPHIRNRDNSENIKFLRLHRFQKANPSEAPFEIDSDINCLACHKKAGWAGSVHADEAIATHTLESTETQDRDFPDGITVWQTACLSCHDTHTVSGARWLLRKGDGAGSESDIEQTCYQCHGSTSILTGTPLGNVESIAASNPHGTSGVNDPDNHVIRSGNFEESSADLKSLRHVVCTDCHNPHRTIRNSAYNGLGSKTTQATHVHDGSEVHSNTASGALRGVMGVEPDYDGIADTFSPFDNALGFKGLDLDIKDQSDVTTTHQVLAGDISVNTDTTQIVTKEYQVCLKCHSNYGISNADLASNTKRNIAMEFQPKNDSTRQANNHNSWHPVTTNPNRTSVVVSDNFEVPFNQGIGTQTMYCSDCHNNDAAGPKGPHGSSQPELLIAAWSENTGSATTTDLCFQCHKYSAYADSTATPGATNKSNFSGTGFDNLHITHAEKATSVVGADAYTCSLCHVNSAHGWKNKALLVDKNVADAALDAIYYTSKAKLAIDNYRDAGQWLKADCASSGCHTP